MAESILQSYLTLQHIKLTDESSIENLKKSVTEVKKQLTRKKLKALPYTLVALDPKIKDTDPIVQEVEKIIVKKWSTFKNNVTATKDKSTTYVRAVILESLSQLAKGDAVFAALVWHTARDVVKHYQLDAEKDTVAGLLQNVADYTEANGQASWSINRQLPSTQFEGGEISLSSLKSVEIDEKELRNSIHNAIMYSGWGGENPGYAHQGNQTWSNHAIEHLSKGVAKEFNSAISEQTKSLSSVTSSVKKGFDSYFAKLKPFFEEINSSFVNSITANNKRSELIWWKQVLYSPRLNASYRGLSPMDTAVITAFDLADQVDPIYPISVDYLLRETLKDLQGEAADKKKSLVDWLGEISKTTDDSKSALAKHTLENDERKTLLAALANASSTGSDRFFEETGIDSKAAVSLSDLAVWLFHGLQAHALATSK